MKKIIFTFSLLSSIFTLTAQTLDEGKKHLYYERYQSAAVSFHTALAQNPANAEAWFWLTKSYLLQNEPEKAHDTLAKAPATVHDELYYLLAKGALLVNDSKLNEASVIFEKIIADTRSKDADVLSAIATIHIDDSNGDANQAIGLLEKAIKRDKKDASLLVSLGKAYRKLRNATEAYKMFKEAISRHSLASAYYELGSIFVNQKNPDIYLENFMQAIASDKEYAPAYYSLYDHYLYRDPAKAMSYFQQYKNYSDKSLQQDYSYTDLLYLTGKYDSAILFAKKLLQQEGNKVKPRLYKLIAYSCQEITDTASAFKYMKNYFLKEVDSNMVVGDFENMALLFASSAVGMQDSAMTYFEKAAEKTADTAAMIGYYKNLAGLAARLKDYSAEAKWLGKYYQYSPEANNVTLFNWGLAAYKAQDYEQADSAFGLYTEKYPEQGFGYYWQARSNAAIDTSMELGLAVPHYEKLIEAVNKNSQNATDKKWLSEAYFYLASYETNVEKEYEKAIDYFEKILELDPSNESAQKYIGILKNTINSNTGVSNSSSN